MIRRVFYWLLVAAFIGLVVSRFSEISDLSHILFQGRIQWLLAAAGLQVLQYVFASASYRSAFTTVGVESRVRDLFPLLFGSIFVNVIAPTGGASGAALFVDHAARNGQSTARTTAGIFLQLITSMLSFTVILAAGLAYLGAQNRLELYYVIAAVFLMIAIGLIGGGLFLAMHRPALLKSILHRVQSVLNRLVRRVKQVTLLSDEWIDKQVGEFIEAGTAITTNPSGLAWTLGFLLFAHVLNVAGLYALFLAFSQAISLGSLVAGYAVGVLFLIVSVTPQGIGVVEGIMPLVFGSLGVPSSVATLTVLAFRGLSFWLPLVLGFLLLRKLDVFHTKKTPSPESETSLPEG